MARGNFADALTRVRCDGEPESALPFAYQHRPELVLFCEWLAKKEVRSYLEIGFYQGGLLSTLHEIFGFERVAGCDEGSVPKRRKLPVAVPKAARICWAKSESPEYRRFRHALGMVDVVFIDGDHAYGSVRQDYEREKKQPHRFLAFHDIKNTTQAPGVVRLWNEIGGKKRELYVPRLDGVVMPGDEMGIGLWSQKETP